MTCFYTSCGLPMTTVGSSSGSCPIVFRTSLFSFIYKQKIYFSRIFRTLIYMHLDLFFLTLLYHREPLALIRHHLFSFIIKQYYLYRQSIWAKPDSPHTCQSTQAVERSLFWPFSLTFITWLGLRVCARMIVSRIATFPPLCFTLRTFCC